MLYELKLFVFPSKSKEGVSCKYYPDNTKLNMSHDDMEQVYSIDINTLLTAVTAAIRKGGEMSFVNKVEQMNKIIYFLRHESSDAPDYRFSPISHKVAVLYNMAGNAPSISIMNPKPIDAEDKDLVVSTIENDINALTVGLIYRIRKGALCGYINKEETIAATIDYLNKQISGIEVVQELPESVRLLNAEQARANAN